MRQELRHGLRRLRRNPLFSVTVILTLAVGVGAVTTAFSLVRGILSPLAYPRAGELVRVYETLERLRTSPNPRMAAMANRLPVSYRDTVDWRQSSHSLRGIGLAVGYTAVLETGGEPMDVLASKVDSELLEALGMKPVLGRFFNAREVARRERLVLISHDLWVSAFGADRAILGRALRIDGQLFTVVGVMPGGFPLPGRKDVLWTPAGPTEDDLAVRDNYSYVAIARLASGATLEAAQAEMSRIAGTLAAAYPDTNTDAGVRLVPLLDMVLGDSRRILALLAAAAAAVLLVACVNLILLLLFQAVERSGETALRLALGARRGHLLRQGGIETLILAAGGGAGGLLLAALAHRALPLLLADELPRLDTLAIDWRVAVFAFGTALAVTLLSSLVPVLLTSGNSGTALRQSFTGRRSVRLLQDALVIAEVALTLTLTAGALTLVTSWLRVAAVDPGFEPRGVLVQQIRLPAWQYPDAVRRGDFATRLLAGLEALPGVSAAALTSRLPLPGPAEVWGFRLAGQDAPSRDWTQGRIAIMQFVTPSYLRLLRIPLRAGQDLDLQRGPAAGRVVLINQTLADRHWPGRTAVGTEVVMEEQTYRIEGVFADIRQQGLTDNPGELMLQPWDQRPPTAFAALVRVAGPPLRTAAAVRSALHRLDPALPVPPAALLDDLISRSVAGPRSRALLVGLSAGIALLLALIGTYGVMAYSVSRQRREIAIRMAVGAGRGWVHRWVLGRALVLALAGVCLGALGTRLTGRLLEGLLFGVTAADVGAVAAAALLLIAACLAASWLPARRAGRTDPAAALRGL
ncbi:MAG TPA: ADOP family duplicated permease [Thermoanaerobaculia bacterium]|nr:ADOP family duplicated permease [Thermoanaerobaculia bacterium]